MANAPLPLIAANWKMNGLHSESFSLAHDIAEKLEDLQEKPVGIVICPPFTLLSELSAYLSATPISVSAQDCSPLANGAHTGDVSAEMIKNLRCSGSIVGHSERRKDHKEKSELINSKASALQAHNLAAIICIGETEEERDAGKTLDVVGKQLSESVPANSSSLNTVIAYEPVWAIGTGRTPTIDEVAEVHAFIRNQLFEEFDYDGYAMRILYGGSVNPDNAAEILKVDNVNGALVGGASLKLETFWPIVTAAPIPDSASAKVNP